jgi:catechol 2,3-dioxygenase
MDAIAAPIDPALRVGGAHLAVADLDASVDFYTRAMGLQVVARGEESATLGAHDATPLLTLTRLAAPTPASPRSAGLFHLALLHPTRRDLAATVRRIAGAGWRFTGASDHGVSEALYLRDPDGLGLEVYADRPREEWPRRPDGRIDIYTAALDLEDLLATHPEDEPDPAIAPGTTMGHVHLQVADVDRSVRFYRDALGLDLIAAISGGAFLSATTTTSG